MDERSGADARAAGRSLTHDPAQLERLDRALLRMRRTVIRPESTAVPIPALRRTVDLAKVLACLAISDLQGPDDPRRPVAVKDVAIALTLEHSTASRLLAETEAEGLIDRSTDASDRRRTVVHLTPTGEEVVAQSSAIRTWSIDAILSQWSPDELSAFTALIEKFSDTIEERSQSVLRAALEHFGEGP